MIRIRYLTPGSIADLIVKTAEEQMMARLACKRPCETLSNRHADLAAKPQKKWRRR